MQTGIARDEFDIAAEQFRQTFYDAMRDTSDALSARQHYIEQSHWLEQNFDAANDAERLYERRYRAGAVELRNWLDAQERLRDARSSLSANQLNQLNAQVALYQAIGGDAAVPDLQ